MSHRWSRVVVSLVAVMAVTGMSASTGASTVEAEAGGRVGKIQVRTFRFRPKVLRVDTGTKVRWKNRDEILHTITSDTGVFDQELDGAGTKFAHRFEAAGTFEYHCSRHESMTGKVIVEG